MQNADKNCKLGISDKSNWLKILLGIFVNVRYKSILKSNWKLSNVFK